MQTYEVTVDESGTIRWYQNGLLHRTDGPAVEYLNGRKCWYRNGKKHNLNGPAVEWLSSGGSEYWIEGKYFTKNEFLKYTTMKTKSPAKELTVAEIEKLLGHPVKVVK